MNIVSIVLHLLVGIGAAAGGMAAVLNPVDPLGAPAEMLKEGPFEDFLIPGIILFALLGLGNIASATVRLLKGKAANLAGCILGAALVIWIVVQCWILQAVGFLHVLFFVIGSVQGLTALIQLWRTDQFPANIVRRMVGSL